jgi:hypothetical protein
MPDAYITKEQLTTSTPGDDGSSADPAWELFAGAVSRLFDRECEVEDGFFANSATTEARDFVSNGTRYLWLGKYTPDSITSILIDGTEYFTDTVADRKYREREGFLILAFDLAENITVTVTAEFGFGAVPDDIQQACIEQGLAMWRRKDMSFADLSGVSGAVATAELTPTFKLVTERYRALYSQRSYFS